MMLNCPAYDIAPTARDTFPISCTIGNTSSKPRAGEVERHFRTGDVRAGHVDALAVHELQESSPGDSPVRHHAQGGPALRFPLGGLLGDQPEPQNGIRDLDRQRDEHLSDQVSPCLSTRLVM